MSDSDVGSEQSGSESGSESEEEETTDQPLRVYDARFKIPAQSNLGQLMANKGTDMGKTQLDKQYRNLVKRVERYKKFVSTAAIVLMAAAMLFNISSYCWLIKDL